MPTSPSPHALLFIFITVLLDSIGFGIIMPVMPTLIVELVGGDLSGASIYGGWLMFVFAAMQFLFAPTLGNLSDRFGRRPVILLALGTLAFDYFVMALAPSIAWLFAGRAIAGIAGASFTPAYAYVADVTSEENRGRAFGLVGAAFGAGFILGPAVGGLLGEFGPRAPFYAAAAVTLANLAYGCFVLPESLPVGSRRPFEWRRANPAGMLLQMRKHPAVLALLAAIFIWNVAGQVYPSTWAFFTMYKFGWSQAAVGASLAAAGAIIVLSQGFVSRLLFPRLGEARTTVIGLLAGAAGFLGYAFASEGWMMYAWLLTWLLGGIVYPGMNALASRLIAADAQGELQGAVASSFGLSSIIGPPLMTQLFGQFSEPGAALPFPGAAFACAAVLALATLPFMLGALREENAKRAR
jgi:DHA1 family tetracycline resistance protein-like MFS transporter